MKYEKKRKRQEKDKLNRFNNISFINCQNVYEIDSILDSLEKPSK